MKILVLAPAIPPAVRWAQGFPQSFDAKLTMRSAGTDPADRVNPHAIEAMKEAGVDISDHSPETCPVFLGKVNRRFHMGFEDPAAAKGAREVILVNSGK